MIEVEHELHKRRASRNFGLLAVLVGFAALVFGLTIAKVETGDTMKAWDHRMDNAMLPPVQQAGPAAVAPPASIAPTPAAPGAAQ